METLRVLVTVKASPAISQKYGEVVCVAGIDIDKMRWVRLWPISYRDLPYADRFKKYSIVQLQARKASDPRPESYTPINSTIHVVQKPLPAGKAKKRRAIIEPLVQASMCAIREQQQIDGTSLGVFRPGELLDFSIENDSLEWDPDKQAIIDQPSLLMPYKSKLEKVPYKFKYTYRCNDANCSGHTQSIIDWEISQAFRTWRDKYGEEVALQHIRERWTNDPFGEKRDSFIYTGNQFAAPKSFLVLGVFWPEKLG